MGATFPAIHQTGTRKACQGQIPALLGFFPRCLSPWQVVQVNGEDLEAMAAEDFKRHLQARPVALRVEADVGSCEISAGLCVSLGRFGGSAPGISQAGRSGGSPGGGPQSAARVVHNFAPADTSRPRMWTKLGARDRPRPSHSASP